MQADRQRNESQVNALEATCRRQAHELQTLSETVSVFRKGAHSLGVENARLREEVSSMRALAAHARAPSLDTDVTEARLPLNAHTPGTARAIVAEFLRDRVPHGLLDRAKLIVSELTSDGVSEGGALSERYVVLRIESSPTTVRVELDATGGMRTWAQLRLSAPLTA